MAAAEYEAFRADIAADGILCPLEITEEGLVLDGRQRLRAARELGLKAVPVRVIAVEDPLDFMLRAALLRRQLAPSQRAALALELERYRGLRAQARGKAAGQPAPGLRGGNRHELLLLARKGSFGPPEPEDRVDSVLEAPRGRHSEKPEALYELIERMYPQASKLELFARRRRPGWAAWGNEVPK
jgi:hypothetical protein